MIREQILRGLTTTPDRERERFFGLSGNVVHSFNPGLPLERNVMNVDVGGCRGRLLLFGNWAGHFWEFARFPVHVPWLHQGS